MKRGRPNSTKTTFAGLRPLTVWVACGGLFTVLVVAAWVLWPWAHLVQIQTVPPVADITVDGQPVGQSPLEAMLRSRYSKIEAKLAGFETATLRYQRGDLSEPVRLVLQPQPATCTVSLLPGNIDLIVSQAGAVVTGSGARRTIVIEQPQPGQRLTFTSQLRGHPDQIHEVALGPGVKTALEIRFPSLLKLTTQPANLPLTLTVSSPHAQVEPDDSVPGGWLVRVAEPVQDSNLQLQLSVAGLEVHQQPWTPRIGLLDSENIRLPVAVFELPKWTDDLSVSIRNGGRVVNGPEGISWLVVHCPQGERTAVVDFLRDEQVLATHTFHVESARISAAPSPLAIAVYEISVQPPEATINIEGAGTLLAADRGKHRLLVLNPDGKDWIKLKADSDWHQSVHQLITPVKGIRESISIKLPHLSEGFERVLPGDVFLFVNVSDYGSFKDRLLQLRGVQMCQDPAMQPFVDQFLSNSQKSASTLKAQSGIDIVRLCAAHTGQICLAVAANRPAEGGSAAYAISDVPGNHDTVQGMLNQAGKILEDAGFQRHDRGDLQIFTGVKIWTTGEPDQRGFTVTEQDVLVAGSDPDRLQALLSRLAENSADDAEINNAPLAGRLESLANNPRLKRFRTQTNGVGDFEVFADLHALFQGIADPQRPETRGQGPDWFGLGGYFFEPSKLDVAGLSFSIAREDYETNLQWLLGTKARPLAFRLFDMPAATLEPEPWIPADVVGYWSGTWDLDRFELTLAQTFPVASAGISMYGRALGSKGIKSLGNRLTVAIEGPQDGDKLPVPRPLFAWQLDDSQEIAAALARQMKPDGLMARYGFEEERQAGRTVYLLPFFFRWAITVTDTHLLIGERSFVLRVLNPLGPGLAKDPEYQRVANLIPDRTSMTWFYRSTQQFRLLHTVLQSGWAKSLGLTEWPALKSLLDSLSGEKLPPLQQLRQYAVPSGGYLIMDDKGVHAVHFTVKPQDQGAAR